jgi:tetratricopeptide (TPR) repeat protein
MKSNFWAEVEDAYDKVCRMPAEERGAFLDQTYQDRLDIRSEVESLLQFQPAADRMSQSTLLASALDLFNDDDQSPIGSVVAGRYLVRERLGTGPMSEVFRADHVTLDTPFALKRAAPGLKNDPEFRRRLIEEARRAVVLKHDNVARVHDIVESGGDLFVVMEYIEGATLRARLKALGCPMSTAEFLDIAIQCALALAAAHEKLIVHLDVKPENIMLTSAGKVKVCDFGVARKLSKTADNDTTAADPEWTFAGTPAYMAPEVILSNRFDETADQFSLGVVFYEMLTGRNPFLADTIVATTAHVVKDGPPSISEINPAVDRKLDRIVMRLLAKDPEKRYSTVHELVEELEKIRRSQDRMRHITASVREAIAEYGSIRLAFGFLFVCLAVAAPTWIYRDRVEQWLGIASLPERKVLVVLPLRVIGDAAVQTLSVGLTETLTATLSEVAMSPKLEVVPASAVRGSGITTPEQARKHSNANLVLEASLQPIGERVRVNIALIETKRLNQLRGNSFTIPQLGSLSLQNQVVEAAIKLLEVELKTEQRSKLSAQSTRNESAYQAYLEGTGYLISGKPGSLESAINAFREALALDANFGPAYAGLGQAYWARYGLELKDPQPQMVQRAREACEKALALDSAFAAGYVCIGNIEYGTGSYQLAVERYGRALELEPNNFDAYRGLARSYEGLNNWEAAEATYIKAIDVRPSYYYNYVWLAQFYQFSRQQYAEAISTYKKAIDRAPENPEPYMGLCGAQIFAELYAEAIQACSTSIGLHEAAASYINLGVAYWDLRNYSMAANSFEHAVELNPRYYKAVGHLARAYSSLPDKQAQAPDLYRKAIDLADQELEINPQNANIQVMIARYHAMLGHRVEALSHLQLALSLRPKDAEYQEIAAVIHNQFGDRDVAIGYLDRAIAAGYSPGEISTEKELDNLREDPQFRALITNQTKKGESNGNTRKK